MTLFLGTQFLFEVSIELVDISLLVFFKNVQAGFSCPLHFVIAISKVDIGSERFFV